MLGGVVVERQQLVQVIGDLCSRLRELRAVGRVEGLRRGAGVVLVLGAPDLREGFLRSWVSGFSPFQNPSAPSPTDSTGATDGLDGF